MEETWAALGSRAGGDSVETPPASCQERPQPFSPPAQAKSSPAQSTFLGAKRGQADSGPTELPPSAERPPARLHPLS